MKDITRNAICLIIGYIVLWYAGAMFGFLPFLGDSDGVAFTGFLMVVVIVICTCWIIDTIQKKDKMYDNPKEKPCWEPNLKWEDLKKDPQGLVPVIIQDAENGEVLMMAYMNEQAYEDTLHTGLMHYYSRSRKEQWLKGETSGHYQHLKSLTADCDKDTLLARIDQEGAACHTGSRSCFFNKIVEQ